MSLSNLTRLTHLDHSRGDPRVLQKGPSSMIPSDRLTRALGWFSVGLGLMELLAPGRLARSVGLDDKQGLVRAFGARELASAIPTLSVDKTAGLEARIAGDVLDRGMLATVLHRHNSKRRNAAIATALVAGVTVLDCLAYAGVRTAHRRGTSDECDYSDRTGLPLGVKASRGLARNDFKTPPDFVAEGGTAAALGVTPS